jgi:hypothetical protein
LGAGCGGGGRAGACRLASEINKNNNQIMNSL